MLLSFLDTKWGFKKVAKYTHFQKSTRNLQLFFVERKTVQKYTPFQKSTRNFQLFFVERKKEQNLFWIFKSLEDIRLPIVYFFLSTFFYPLDIRIFTNRIYSEGTNPNFNFLASGI